MDHGLRLLDAGQVTCGGRGLTGGEAASTLGGGDEEEEQNLGLMSFLTQRKSKDVKEKFNTGVKEHHLMGHHPCRRVFGPDLTGEIYCAVALKMPSLSSQLKSPPPPFLHPLCIQLPVRSATCTL